MFLLVAKIISWKTKSQDSHAMQNQNKITKHEWKRYEKHLLSISKTQSVEEVKEKLQLTYSAIEENLGFE